MTSIEYKLRIMGGKETQCICFSFNINFQTNFRQIYREKEVILYFFRAVIFLAIYHFIGGVICVCKKIWPTPMNTKTIILLLKQ